ncbi:MAG TPA: DUF2007 domain-containing protein [Tenuifilaceae bacterium]|nr:DUF2007 domain-containing protein [Tenuifilaceae bacterium]
MVIELCSATYPSELYVLKGRLESEGISCFISNENVIAVHPFFSNAVGGARLMVSTDDYPHALTIYNEFICGEMDISISDEFDKVKEELRIRSDIRQSIAKNAAWVEPTFTPRHHNQQEVEAILHAEQQHEQNREKEPLTWPRFIAGLIDGGLSRYIRRNSTEFYLEDELISTNERVSVAEESSITCPKCGSVNVKFGFSVHQRQGVGAFILTFLFSILFAMPAPFPKYRKRYHCFDCGEEFRIKLMKE